MLAYVYFKPEGGASGSLSEAYCLFKALRDMFKDKVALSVTVSCHEHVSLC